MAESSKQALLSSSGFDEYNTELQTAALKATRNAAFLPSDLNFYRSLDRGLAKEVDTSSSRVLSLANRLLYLVSTGQNTSSRVKGKARLEDDDDVTDNFRSLVVDSMDQLLERADICLDEFLGLSKPPAIEVNAKPVRPKVTKNSNAVHGRLDPALQHASSLPKPQLRFKQKVDNSDFQWRPTLKHKYNAQIPLGYDLRNDEDVDMDRPLHPYQHEIKNISYPPHMFSYAEPVPPKSFEATPFKWVTTPHELSELLDSLRTAREIAVDLEYHSYRSYHGFVCLMQISTRAGDWIVDTLAVREELEELNEVFTDPKIVKVFHGAESDIVWLQQDFNLYIVNLFDTFHASKVLEFPRHGLATLMEMYCDFVPDKRYQLADWRIRPLPQEMIQYARSDTHFLLFIYDNLRNALLDRSNSRAQSRAQSPNAHSDPQASRGSSPQDDVKYAILREVLSRSEGTALRVYEKDRYDAKAGSGPGGWDTLAKRWNKGALMASERTTAKARIYREVHAWRDRVAREEDESTGYILPNRNLFMLAEQPPNDIATLLSMFHHVNPVFRRRSKELLDTIREAAKESILVDTPPEAPSAEVTQDVMDVDQAAPVVSASQAAQDSPDRLWPQSVGGQGLRTTSSSLFGASTAVHKQVGQTLYVASRSTLFANLGEASSSDVRTKRFLSAVARIHEGLVIAPTAPKVAQPMAAVANVAPVEPKGANEVVGAQVEIPFVPANERHETKHAALDVTTKDSIVVVGQASRKKRKRTKGESATSKVAKEEQASEPFDYSTVPNILDEGSDHEAEAPQGTRKRKQKAQGRFDYGNFPAPPKAQSSHKEPSIPSMNYANYILPLRVPLGMAQASKRPRWNRKFIQGSFILLGFVSLFALYEYATYFVSEDTSQDAAELYDAVLDTVYLPFQPTPYQPSLTLKPTSPLSDACIDDHFAQGKLCFNPQQPRLDVLWTWVNGSDLLLQDAKTRVENSYPSDAPYRPNKSWKQARQFRDHDELRHSMRSVLEHFRSHAGNFHLLASDFYMPLGPNMTTDRPWRLGQVPQWLNTKQATQNWLDGRVHLSVAHHADIFYPYSDTIFNSYAIESQFGHLTDIADNFVYMNDDFFFMDTLTDRTFYTSVYGLVFRMQSDLLVSPTQYPNNVKGEWRSLAASNVLLSARFGSRQRPYVAHEAKSASLAILHEMSVIWSSQVSTSATHPFRETLHGESDFSIMFMMVHFVVERWREALLWSWIVGKHGGVDNSWTDTMANDAWQELGGTEGSKEINVQAPHRDSLDPKRVESNLYGGGSRQSDSTNYVFTSQDGYPYVNIDKNKKQWPRFGADVGDSELPACTINYDECFTVNGKGWHYNMASDTFKNIAFRNPACGDCVILALLKASGNVGLSAFLPPPERTLSTLAGKAPVEKDEVPHLPLVENWEDGDFAIRDVMASSRDMSVRSWTLQLLSRYRFVIGETPSHFAMLTGTNELKVMIRKLARESVALLCINDDVYYNHDQVAVMLKAWQDERWKHHAAWEL
ncbi:hypothetical protein NM688_g420 [Phlebia brevispora]|uniref:Uncharacterized protein n=1 Tax=Phlebia brevispora TaxID=194682 RepID=A0ACC1TEE5_9APHY|nr:hypothetical protein NM688_g420 [Phlebia brevispora]